MSIIDQELFPSDVRTLNWTTFTRDYVIGVRKYIIGEDHCSQTLLRLKVMHYFVKYFLIGILVYFLYLLAGIV